MTRFPRIQLLTEVDRADYLYDAFLIDGKHAAAVMENGDIMVEAVRPSDWPGVYLPYGNEITLGYGANDSEVDVGLVYDRLRNMSAWDLVTRFMLTSSQGSYKFDMLNMVVVDPCGHQ